QKTHDRRLRDRRQGLVVGVQQFEQMIGERVAMRRAKRRDLADQRARGGFDDAGILVEQGGDGGSFGAGGAPGAQGRDDAAAQARRDLVHQLLQGLGAARAQSGRGAGRQLRLLAPLLPPGPKLRQRRRNLQLGDGVDRLCTDVGIGIVEAGEQGVGGFFVLGGDFAEDNGGGAAHLGSVFGRQQGEQSLGGSVGHRANRRKMFRLFYARDAVAAGFQP